jgi:hypothetical protein
MFFRDFIEVIRSKKMSKKMERREAALTKRKLEFG